MSGGFNNKPRILRGAFMEYGLSAPPLLVMFQFNPDQLTRNRSLSFSPPSQSGGGSKESSLRAWHKDNFLHQVQAEQEITIEEEAISFDIRLDATDRLNDGEFLAERFGISPQLAALEMMVLPKGESRIGKVLDALRTPMGGFSFSRSSNPPMILFIWGRKRVLPVNISSMNITETEFNTFLEPVRATVSVSLKVIEGNNIPYSCTKLTTESMAAVNLANLEHVDNVVIPG